MQGYYENHRDTMTQAHAWYAINDHFTPHFHNSIELVYVIEGELVATLDGVAHRAAAGTMVLNSSYTVHSYETPAHSRSIIAILPLSQVPTVRQRMMKHAFASPLCGDDAKGTLGALMRMMVDADENLLALKGLSYTLLGLLIEWVGLTEARDSSRAMFIRDVLEFLQQHYAEPLSVERVASHFGYSRSRFSHLFSTHLGHSVPDYVGAIRCQRAAQLLRETDMAVSDVAMTVGFESLRTFYRTFKKQYEMTPNGYARA